MQSAPGQSHAPVDERGLSVSTLVTAVMAAFFVVCGLVIDGGAQVSAERRAQVVAAQAARAGTDASALQRLAGVDRSASAVRAAQAVLERSAGVTGAVTVSAGRLTVHTHSESRTTFLSLVGVDRLAADGSATAELRVP